MTGQGSAAASGRGACDWRALSLLVVPALCGVSMALTLGAGGARYVFGQLAGAVFFLQAFILLHEFGHGAFFTARWANRVGGYVASFLVFIPFPNWKLLHGLHHVWTGFRDVDPTTESTFADQLSPRSVRLVNFCWRWSLPLFTFGYRIGIFWNVGKLRRHLTPQRVRVCRVHGWIYLAAYAAILAFAGGVVLTMLPALLLSFVFCDVLTLSQHSHIDMPLAAGESVRPISCRDQVQYTRSLIFPRWFARYVLLNFNYHEAHHSKPALPCYRLDGAHTSSENAFAFLPWIRHVKSMPGVDFIFRTDRARRGF